MSIQYLDLKHFFLVHNFMFYCEKSQQVKVNLKSGNK